MKLRSMRGVDVDMNRLMALHADVPALGNANMNARGDVILPNGQIVRKREDIVREYHRSKSTTVARVSLADIPSEVMSPAQALQAAVAPQEVIPVAKTAHVPKRKLTDD